MSLIVLLKAPKDLASALTQAADRTFQEMPRGHRTKMLGKRKGPHQLEIVVVGSAKSKALNFKYRGKNRPTDVLSFSLLEGPPFPGDSLIGSLILCLPVARKQAKEYGLSLADEMRRLVVHGVLHVFGYDHERGKKEERIMFRIQDGIWEKMIEKPVKRESQRPGRVARRASRVVASKRK